MMSDSGPRPRWLFRYGTWVRRSLLAAAVAIPLIGKASHVPENSPMAKYGFFVVVGLGGACLLLYAVEYLLAVCYRGYWFDHHFE